MCFLKICEDFFKILYFQLEGIFFFWERIGVANIGDKIRGTLVLARAEEAYFGLNT